MSRDYPLRLQKIRDSFRCVSCNGLLADLDGGVQCSTCGIEYGFVRDAIALCKKETLASALQDEESDVENKIKNWFKRWPNFYHFITNLIVPVLFNGLTVKRFLKRFPEDGRLSILNVGAGPIRYHVDAVGVDLFPFMATDVLADAAELPFADAVFDVTCSEQVLEHVSRPFDMVHEMIRVTKPGGLVYIGAPFVYPYHPSPKDYTRWTFDGLCELTKKCQVVEKGMMAGPTSGMLSILAVWFSILVSFGYPPVQKFLAYVFMLVLSPFKLLDFVYAKLPGADAVACSLYIVVQVPKDRV